jgi:predicted deacylase
MHHHRDWSGYLESFAASAMRRGFTARKLADLAAGPLMAWELPGEGPVIYLSAGIHGDEPAGPLALLELMDEGFFTSAAHWLICPALNPDGLAAASRENAAGEDLNRDYLKRRHPQTAAHADWLTSRPLPDLFISLHEDWETGGFYLYEINLEKDRPQNARAIIDAVRPWFHPEPGPLIDGHEAREDGWIFHAAEADVPEGWPEAIFLAHLGCPLSFTFETPSQAALADRVSAHVAAVRTATSLISRRVRA